MKKLSHCHCDKLTQNHRPSWFEAILLFLLPHFDIIKTLPSGETTLYLRRFYVWRSKWIGKNWGDLYIHHITRSDDDPDPHTHPWNFFTFVFWGGYRDERWGWTPANWDTRPKRTRGEDLVIRAPYLGTREREHIHRVIIDKPGSSAWSLVGTGPQLLTDDGDGLWYFVKFDRKVFWREYLNIWGSHGS